MKRSDKYGLGLQEIVDGGTACFTAAARYNDMQQVFDLADDIRDWTRAFLSDDKVWNMTHHVMVKLLVTSIQGCAPTSTDSTIYTQALRYLHDKYENGRVGEGRFENTAIFSACLAYAIRDGLISDIRDLH